MKVRRLLYDDYVQLANWFSKTEWPLPAVRGVIPVKNGFVAEADDGTPVACAFLRMDGTRWSELTWVNSNGELPPETQDRGVEMLLDAVKEAVKHVTPPVELIVSYTNSDAFSEQLKSQGFRIKRGYSRATWVVSGDRKKA